MSLNKVIEQFKKLHPNLSKLEIKKIITIFSKSIKKALKNNKKVELRNFGTFFTKKMKEKYSARNPKTGELIYIPEKKRVRFKVSKNLKIKINE